MSGFRFIAGFNEAAGITPAETRTRRRWLTPAALWALQ